MKAVIFAGGVGTRLWPLSRKNSPKQFEKIIGEKSTLRLSVERLRPEFPFEDIYVSSGGQYRDLIKEQVPEIPEENLIFEPEARDVGPAVGLVSGVLNKIAPDTPFAILWSDHLIKNVDGFKKALLTAGKIIEKNAGKIIFMGQKPRYPSQNLGWIEFGKKVETEEKWPLYEFKKWHYRPDLSSAVIYYKSGHHLWNPGYFVSTPKFILHQYKKFVPQMYRGLVKIAVSYGQPSFAKTLKEIYPSFPKISFDNAILEQLPPKEARVIFVDLGWSDVGAWEALKEALQTSTKENVIRGKVLLKDCQDCLVYNYTDQLVTTIDLHGYLVVNTNDATLVCHKDSVPKIKKLVEEMEGTENNYLT